MSGAARLAERPPRARLRPAWPVSAEFTSIKSSWPVHAVDEIDAVAKVLRSGRVNALQHGDECRAFESEFAAYFSVPHAISLANGTLALELALRALQIGPGDEVIVPARSFFASASCAAMCGATPVFADIDWESQNVTAATIAAAITPRTRAVIVVHLAGWPCPMDEIVALAEARRLFVVEDCAQAHGACYCGKPVGSFGDAAAFSFCTDKIMSTGGEGGMATFRDAAVWERARSFKDHGMDFAAASASCGTGFKWVRKSIGSNYRMTEMQAAIGRRQLAKLPGWLATRRHSAALLNARLSDAPGLRLTLPGPSIDHAYYKYYAFVRTEQLRRGWTRDRIVSTIGARGCPCFTGICPEIYREEAFAHLAPNGATRLPIARRLGEESLMLQVDPTLSREMIEQMARIVREVLSEAAM